jgi:hypothetical protein
LRSLEVFDGDAIRDEHISTLIQKHCPKFEAFAFYSWVNPECDEKLAKFFSGLPEHSLRSFTTFSLSGFGGTSCLALNHHSQSLKALDLQLGSDVLSKLDLLKGCTALEILNLRDTAKIVDLESTQHDVFLGMIAWLLECRNLHSLSLDGFSSGAAICVPVCLDQNIHLKQLELGNYSTKDQDDFHQALAHQTSLERLILNSEALEFRDSLDIITHSVCQLKQLRSLRLITVAANFDDKRISAISENLDHLEDLFIGGLSLSDISLESVALLKNLRSVAFSGTTIFTLEGLLDFIARLGPGNRGMVLAIDNADPERGLSESEQAYVRQTLAEQVDGRLEYTLLRGGPYTVDIERDFTYLLGRSRCF